MNVSYEKAKSYIYCNARPLDFARWKFLFEDGTQDEVLHVLSKYQNSDGGFGSGLEADCWNPYSSPIQTWTATEIIREVNLEDKNHPIIQGILTYLSSGEAFDGHTWGNTIPSNNEYPRASWWSYSESNSLESTSLESEITPSNYYLNKEVSYNPTAALAGFIIKYGESGTHIYEFGKRIVQEAMEYLKVNYPSNQMHTISCYTRLYEYLIESGDTDWIDLVELKALLNKQLHLVITQDISKWNVSYVCKPSLFLDSIDSPFYQEIASIADYECEFIEREQKEDGTWNVTWGWDDYLEEWAIAKNWWTCDIMIKNMKYLSGVQKKL